jgi:hypothetical protein
MDTLTDWMEASVLIDDEGVVTAPELVSFLVEKEVYEKQDFCWDLISNALSEMRRRTNLGPYFPFTAVKKRLQRVHLDWTETPAHLFLVLLTLSHRYDKWDKVMPIDYNAQGDLFERLTKESLEHQFPKWEIHRTGWSRANPTKLSQIVEEITYLLGELQGDLFQWAEPEAHEAGLDLLCYRPFADSNVGIPVLMLQCASGHWKASGKLQTPDLRVWTKIVQFASTPKRAFATPFCFESDRFRRISNQIDGILFDRYRLLSFERPEREWLSEGLREELIAWVKARLFKLEDLAK